MTLVIMIVFLAGWPCSAMLLLFALASGRHTAQGRRLRLYGSVATIAFLLAFVGLMICRLNGIR